MQYKTIILEMLQSRPRMHESLRASHKLLETVESMAVELRTSHEAWKGIIAQQQMTDDPTRVSSQAFEMALKELEDRLPRASATDDQELSLDQAMAFVRSRSPRG